jgi:hypothetical protein
MLYLIQRNGHTYGPYTVEDLQRYVASGNVLLTDLARPEGTSDDPQQAIPVGQLLGVASVPPPRPVVAPPYPAPYPLAALSPYPDPPNLHWVLVLIIGFFTCGLFYTVWDIVQAVWMRRVNPRSNALFLYIAEFAVSLLGGFGRFALMAATAFHHSYLGLGIPLFLVNVTLVELARFDMRRSLEEHYNGPEPIGLSLSGVMTFFFGMLYFQHHLSRIHEMKLAARYRGAII